MHDQKGAAIHVRDKHEIMSALFSQVMAMSFRDVRFSAVLSQMQQRLLLQHALLPKQPERTQSMDMTVIVAAAAFLCGSATHASLSAAYAGTLLVAVGLCKVAGKVMKPRLTLKEDGDEPRVGGCPFGFSS